MEALSVSDHRRVLDVLWTAYSGEQTDPLPESTLAALHDLIPSTIVGYHEWSVERGYRWRAYGESPERLATVWSGYAEVQADDPLPGGRESERIAGLVPAGVAAKMSDFFTLRTFRRLGLHAAMCRPLGIDYVMKIYLETGSPGASVIFDRGGRDFSERDRAVLNTLGPHLALIRRRTRESSARPENEITSMLTAREREVLDLVACGWTNGEIAAALFIAKGTVRKHLDNVYAKLGVRGRAQAVATIRAYPDAAGGAAAGISPPAPRGPEPTRSST